MGWRGRGGGGGGGLRGKGGIRLMLRFRLGRMALGLVGMMGGLCLRRRIIGLLFVSRPPLLIKYLHFVLGIK